VSSWEEEHVGASKERLTTLEGEDHADQSAVARAVAPLAAIQIAIFALGGFWLD
jgi:hypothetical protein